MHHIEIHAVYNLSPVPFLRHKSGVDEGFQVIGKRGRCHAQMLTNLADIQAICPSTHQQSKNCQARVMAKGGKREGGGAVFDHAFQ